MFQGTDKIQDFIRQASSLNAVNTMYYAGMIVLALFAHSVLVPAHTMSEPYLYLMTASWLLAVMGVIKTAMQVSIVMQRNVSDCQFELLIAMGNAISTLLIYMSLKLAGDFSIMVSLLDAFLPTALFVLITPLTWRKKNIAYVGFFGFLEWVLLLAVLGWTGLTMYTLLDNEKWFALMSNATVLISPLFIRWIKQRHYEALKERMHQELYTDPLTQIGNRKYFYDYYDKLRQKNKLSETNFDGLATIFVDIDYFKQYNDHYGHEQGDGCLAEVAQFLEVLAQELGLSAYRLGGEEFLLCGDVSKSAWQEIMENPLLKKWRNGEISLPMQHVSSPTGKLTLSGGACLVAREEVYTLNAVGITKRADEQLYKAKNNGRSILCVWDALEQTN